MGTYNPYNLSEHHLYLHLHRDDFTLLLLIDFENVSRVDFRSEVTWLILTRAFGPVEPTDQKDVYQTNRGKVKVLSTWTNWLWSRLTSDIYDEAIPLAEAEQIARISIIFLEP